MIPDNLFKSLRHCCDGYELLMNGQTIVSGYKPDYVLKKENDFVILESENTSSRKTFIGGLIKAAHFLTGEKTGILIFVMVPKPNTTASSIAAQLRIYFSWVKEKTNLREVFVIEASQYYKEDAILRIGSEDFYRIAIKI